MKCLKKWLVMTMLDFTLDSDTIERFTEACKQLTEAFNRLTVQLTELAESIRERLYACFDNLDYTPGAIKHNTKYKSKVKFRLFDKRLRVHHCRNNC